MALGGVTQLRVLGGTVGVAIATNVLNNFVIKTLSPTLPHDQLEQLLQSTQVIATLEPSVERQVRMVFARGYNMQIGAMLGFSAAEFLAILLMWEAKPRRTA